jgi:hypothetical protein
MKISSPVVSCGEKVMRLRFVGAVLSRTSRYVAGSSSARSVPSTAGQLPRAADRTATECHPQFLWAAAGNITVPERKVGQR